MDLLIDLYFCHKVYGSCDGSEAAELNMTESVHENTLIFQLSGWISVLELLPQDLTQRRSHDLRGVWRSRGGGAGSVGPQPEHLAEPGGGAGVHEEGAFIRAEVLPVSAAERRQAVGRNEALVTSPPENSRRGHLRSGTTAHLGRRAHTHL